MLFAPHMLLTAPARRGMASKKQARRLETLKVKSFKTGKCIRPEMDFDKNFDPALPTRFKNFFKDMPACENWHERNATEVWEVPAVARRRPTKNPGNILLATKLNMEYFQQYNDLIVPLEMTTWGPEGIKSFDRFEGPFSLLLAFIVENKDSMKRLYLAQHSLDDLPQALRDDVPTPADFLKKIGSRGDIYGSSLWMGKSPTRTPLHRDPNPNIFVQLAGRKTVRLLGPEPGKELFERISKEFGAQGGSSSMRGEEMMQGEAMQAIERAIWNDQDVQEGLEPTRGLEITLRKGDGLYIPLGWWHAVRSSGSGPNVSVSLAALT
jgi:hypothetical protein